MEEFPMSSIDVSGSLTQIQNDTTKVTAQQNSKTTGTEDLGQSAFLQLLIAQLKGQDPLNPDSQDSNQKISEEAQFSQVSSLQGISSSSEMMQASSLIGKTVSLNDPNNGAVSGTVSAATVDSKGTNIIVNGTSYALSTITAIENAPASTASSSTGSGS